MSQPVLGILTLYSNQQGHLEERSIYQKMTIAGKKLGLEVLVFTPQDVDEQRHRIYALHYSPHTKSWSRRWTQLPNIIFDRCRFQNNYRFTQMLRFRRKYHHLLFLNRPLSNKWKIHKFLYEIPAFQKYLPSTRLYRSIRDVQEMIRMHPLIYLKPINGTGGRGILCIEQISTNSSNVYVQGRDHQRQILRPCKLTIYELATKLEKWEARHRYLVQQGIWLKLSNDRVHDYRMLIQKDGNGKWEVTGCVGRVGASKSITSNLHGGGQAINMDELLLKWFENESKITEIKDDAKRISLEITQFLEKKYKILCELALDLAIDRTGQVWLLEVNPKPAREIFNQVGDRDTYQLAITRPLEYAAWVYQQQGKD